jgi:RHS repeat-associated protein
LKIHLTVLLLLCGVHGTASACDADPNGPPNCAAAGNPINVITGNKFQAETDLPALPGVLGLEIVRYYNSGLSGRHNTLGVLGRGWRLSYESELAAIGDTVQIRSADGTRYIFSRDVLRPSLCNSTNPSDGTVSTRRTPAGEEFVWRQNDGRRLTFNQQGRLVQIQAPTGEFVSLQHDARGLLVKVTDPQGRSLVLNYLASKDAEAGDRFRGVQSIDSPVGRFGYGYGSTLPPGADASDSGARLANLVRVSLPGGQDQARLYHYEDARRPTFLTGVSVAGRDDKGKPVVERYSTFGYDIDGKAILSTHAGGADKVTLDTSVGGRTVLTNSLGQKTVYRYSMVAGAFRLLEVRGAGCALCGEMDVRYGYDSQGRVTEVTKLDRDGQALHTTRTERDYYGRPRKISKLVYHNSKAGAAQLVARYEYADGNGLTPSLVVRPSVVPGKETSQRYTYNDLGQRLSVTESGWSPSTDAAGSAQAISRTTTYGYRAINGKSLLVQIDGPMKNGPAGSPVDSDITQIEYDEQGRYVQKMTAPGNVVTTVVHRDAAGRPATITQNDGVRLLQQEITRSAVGEPEAVLQTAWLMDAASGGPGTRNEASKLTRKLDMRHDLHGRLLSMQLPAFGWDAAPLAGSGRPEPAPSDAAGVAADSAKRGADAGLRFLRGESGSVTGEAVLEVFADAAGRGAPLAQRWLDDFGRLVAVRYQDQGVSRASYVEQGASGLLETIRDPRGSQARMQYDRQGRLQELTRSDASDKPVERTLFRYAGAVLVEQTVSHVGGAGQPSDSIHWRYDAFGQLLYEGQSSGALTYGVHHAYDQAGRRVRTWLSQESAGDVLALPEIRYAYQADTRQGELIEAIDAGDIWSGRRNVINALRWQLPARQAGEVGQSEPNVAVATAWRWGNGLQASSQFEAVTGKQASRAWRLTGFHDGLHAYAVDSTADGRILGVSRDASVVQRGVGELRTSQEPMVSAVPEPPLDAAGNQLWLATRQGRYGLVWNAAGQLTQVLEGDREVASYRYDAQGRRVAKVVVGDPSASRHFIYSGTQLLAEADADGKVIRQFIYLGQRPVAWIEPAQTLMQRFRQFLSGPKIVYLHTDHRGAVTAATAHDQAVLWQAGADLAQGASASEGVAGFDQPLRLAGQYADPETGLSYNLARYYDPRSGGFISPDPAGLAAGSLDLYAYAGGDYLNFFDPDGWAKVTYYAITAGANGTTSLGADQGFTKARWAFVISDIAGGIKSNVIYDPTGGFVRNNFQGNKGDAYAWNAGDLGGDPVQMLNKYYGNNLISMGEFTIDNFNDANAKGILSALGYADPAVHVCLPSGLPPIPFGPDDAPIDVTKLIANGANQQRILNCAKDQKSSMPIQYANDAERDRIEKFEAAAELNEISTLGKNCSEKGCPGATIKGQTGYEYHASYGRTQFTGDQFLLTINKLSAAEKAALGITAEMQNKINAALKRSLAVGGKKGFFNEYRKKYSCSQAAAAWDNAGQGGTPAPLTQDARADFTKTGLGRQAFIDMVCFVPQGNARPEGEGRNAFMTEAIFSDVAMKNWMMDIFKSDDKFGYLSRVLMKKNLANVSSSAALAGRFDNTIAPRLSDGSPNPAYAARQRAIEEELAMRVARLHNGGKVALLPDPALLTRTCVKDGPNKNTPLCDGGSYVKKFIGLVNDGHGDWRSLRCTADAKTGTGGQYTGSGLDFVPLNLPSKP